MIRMVLIYVALFAVAAGAIWMKPASNGLETAALDDAEFRDLTHLPGVSVYHARLENAVTVTPDTLAAME